MKEQTKPVAMVPAQAVGAQFASGVVLCAVSLVASARPMQIQLPKLKMPELPSLPKLPDLDLPNFGKKKDAPVAKPKVARPITTGGKVKVRAAKGVVASGSEDAPTLADLGGEITKDSIDVGEGWKRFPERRMPGANMDGWKKIAKDITPEF